MKKLLLIGTGPMACDYMKVIQALNISVEVIGRGETSALEFEKKTGVRPYLGGLQKYLSENVVEESTFAIISTGTESLLSLLTALLQAGIQKVLIEKPGALSIEELVSNRSSLENYFDRIFVAYNRRFYQSVLAAEKLIEQDGGLKTVHFEFTEWVHLIESAEILDSVKSNWFFGNSTHVVDLAFFFAGRPKEMSAYSVPGELIWHNKTNFAGAGITESNVVFSYVSNWESAGRWAIELMTNKRRIILKPLEGILIQERGSVAIVSYHFDDSIDKDFKPGLYNQVIAFLNGDKRLLNMEEQIWNANEIYKKIIA
jgi:predicted dehydrogenase